MEHQGPADEKLDDAVEDMQSDAEKMKDSLDKLDDRIADTTSDRDSKQHDDAVPGEQPGPDDEAERPAGEEPAYGGNGDSGQQLEHTSGNEQSEEQDG
jgi:hypothetical protein